MWPGRSSFRTQGQRQGGGAGELALGPDGSGGLGCVEHPWFADPLLVQKTEITAIKTAIPFACFNRPGCTRRPGAEEPTRLPLLILYPCCKKNAISGHRKGGLISRRSFWWPDQARGWKTPRQRQSGPPADRPPAVNAEYTCRNFPLNSQFFIMMPHFSLYFQRTRTARATQVEKGWNDHGQSRSGIRGKRQCAPFASTGASGSTLYAARAAIGAGPAGRRPPPARSTRPYPMRWPETRSCSPRARTRTVTIRPTHTTHHRHVRHLDAEPADH